MADVPDEMETNHGGGNRPLAPVLVLSILAMAITPFLSGSAAGRGATALLIGGTAVVALRRSDARPALILSGEAVLALVTAISVVSREAGAPDDALSIVALGLLCLLLAVTPTVVVLRLTTRPRITLDTVAGALAAYIQIGLFFATLFRFVGLVQDQSFFAEVGNATVMDFQFFSFVTLTTLGYGNLVPAGDTGQSLATFEAIIGQVFLVTVVALAISNLGADIPRRGTRRGGGDAQAAPR